MTPRPGRSWRSILFAWLVAASAASPAFAQAPDDHAKLTFGDYLFADQSGLDVNLRYSLSDWTGWVGYYAPTDGARQGRVGIEYDLRTRWLFLVPSAQAASAGFYGGSVYSEVGRRLYLIAGASRTNLRPYVNLNFDPNESWQLGGGAHLGKADAIALFSIWDNRLHTGQRNTHITARHYIATSQRVTLDASYKSGLGDDGVFVRGGAIAVEYDWRRWFARVACDQHANYGESTMWRLGGGVRF